MNKAITPSRNYCVKYFDNVNSYYEVLFATDATYEESEQSSGICNKIADSVYPYCMGIKLRDIDEPVFETIEFMKGLRFKMRFRLTDSYYTDTFYGEIKLWDGWADTDINSKLADIKQSTYARQMILECYSMITCLIIEKRRKQASSTIKNKIVHYIRKKLVK